MQMGLLLWMNMVPSLGLVVEWLDESTLGLLFGMMVIVGRLKDTVSAWGAARGATEILAGTACMHTAMQCFQQAFVALVQAQQEPTTDGLVSTPPALQGLFELMAAWAVKCCRGRMGLLSLLLM